MPIRVYYEVLNQKGTPALYSDNYAQRPAAGYVGRIFYSPDTGQIFYDTGSTWTLLADAGVGSGTLASVCANGNTTATGISITAGGLSTNSLTSTNLTAGSIPFIGTGGLFSQDNTNLFWDNTNKWLGLNTNTPTAPLDLHITANVGIQINNTTTADSKIAFLQAGAGKWRIGNLYSGGSNLFHIYNNTAISLAMQIDSTNAALFYGSLSSNSFIAAASGITLTNGGTTTTAGATNIGGLTAGLNIALASGFNQTLTFPTGVSYTYTFPSATGTIALTSNLSSYLPLTGGTLTGSLIGTDATFSTTSNQVLTLNSTATTNQIYFQSSGTLKGKVYFNNTDNLMAIGTYSTGGGIKFEIDNNIEAVRITSAGNFGIGYISASEKLEVEGRIKIRSGNALYFSNGDNTATSAIANGEANTSSSLLFYTGGAQTMAISKIGELYWNVSGTTAADLQNGGVLFRNNSNKYVQVITGSTADSPLIYFYKNDGAGGITLTGSISTTGNNTAYNTTSSDRDLKKNFEEWNEDILSIFKNSNPKLYNFISEEDNAIKTKGFIAQELFSYFPEAYPIGQDEKHLFNPSGMVVYLMKALKDAAIKIEDLSNKINA